MWHMSGTALILQVQVQVHTGNIYKPLFQGLSALLMGAVNVTKMMEFV